MTTWYNLENATAWDTPALVVYPERVQHNIDLAIQMINDVARLRPHVKTHKCKEVALMMIEAGITKFKCSTIAEAEMLGLCKAPDVLLAYQPVGAKLQRFLTLIELYTTTQFSCLVDDLSVAQVIAQAGCALHRDIPVYIDLNVGMNRTGITPDKAKDLELAIQDLHGITVKGWHVYDGHIRNTDLEARTKACNEAYKTVETLHQSLLEAGIGGLEIIVGGSPSFPIHLQRPKVECSPGTFVFWDKGYAESCPEQGFLPAALVLGRVVSKPTADTLCIDIGHKSIAAENELSRRIHFLNAPEATFISQSEEHLVIQVAHPNEYPIGTLMFGLPIHICPTVALYEKAYLAVNQQLTAETWKIIARDRRLFT